MKKSYIIAPLALLIVGGAYAMTGLLFPDTPGFPRIPTGEGTVGGMIARVLGISDLLTYSGDGMVKNTSMLSGTTATGYLKRTDVCTSGQYWTGIGPDGKATCGSTTILLADMGTITDVGNGMTIFRADGTTITPVSVPTTVKSGDIIKTDGTGTGTITFSDLSIIRLDTDTTVSMDQTTSGTGVTVASALLANGSVWGRILTDTGVYNIGSSDIVAAVRGTSIVVIQTGATTSVAIDPLTNKFAITKTGTQGKTVLSILDSALGTGTISSVNCRKVSKVVVNNGMAGNNPPEGYASARSEEDVTTSIATGSITPEKMYLVSPGDCTNGSSLSGMSPSALYNMSPWVKENTKKDIIYMVDLSFSGSITETTKVTKIVKELNQTTPKDSTECSNLLGSGSDCTEIVSQKTVDADNIDNPEAPIMAGCKVRNQKYWNIYKDQKDINKKCQDSKIIAIADYTRGTPNLYFSGGIKSLMPMDQLVESNVTLADDKGIWNYRGLLVDNPNLVITGSMYTTVTVGGKEPDATRMSKIGQFAHGYNMVYVNQSPFSYGGQRDGWDNWKYNSLTWLKPQNSGLPNITTPVTGSQGQGINITSEQYISYPTVLFPGGTGGLEGKRITITVSGNPNNSATLVDFGVSSGGTSYRIYTDRSGKYTCSWDAASCNLDANLKDGLTTVSFTAPMSYYIKYFVLGNNIDNIGGVATLKTPIGLTIKQIKVNNQN